MQPGFPALDFPVFGLGSDWDGPRWLWHVNGELGNPLRDVWLAHSHGEMPAAADPRMLVGTMPAARHAEMMAPSHDPAEAVASAALMCLADVITPGRGDENAELLSRRTYRFLSEQAEGYAEWPVVIWEVNGQPVSARVFEWGGGWAGFTMDVDQVAIAAVAREMSTTGVTLFDIEEGGAYHFDAQSYLSYPEVLEAARRAALGEEDGAPGGIWPLHPDQIELLAVPEPVEQHWPLVEDPQTLDELSTYLDHHHACSGSEFVNEDADGRAYYECDCGRASGWYPSASEGEQAVDAHLDDGERAHRTYVEAWLEAHPQTESAVIQGRGWGLIVHGREAADD